MTFIRNYKKLAYAAVAVLVSASPCLVHAQASVDTTTPAAAIGYFPYSAITSANDIIYATRLPVTYNGKTYYEDATVTFKFEVSSTGVVTATAEPVLVASPNVLSNHFVPGTYVGPSNVNSGESTIVVSGPAILSGGATEWNLTLSSTANAYTYPSSADWYVESSLTNSPIAARLKAAGITNTTYSYGLGDSAYDPNGCWSTDALLGFSQVGNVLTVTSFTYRGTDQNTPCDTIPFALKQ